MRILRVSALTFALSCVLGASGALAQSAPDATTEPVTNVTAREAQLNGEVNPNGSETKVQFLLRRESDGAEETLDASQSPITGSSPVVVSRTLSGLDPGTEHSFRVEAENAVGSDQGNLLTFTTENTDFSINDGSSYTPPEPDPGTANNPVGRITVDSDPARGVLESITFTDLGTSEGVNNVRLYRSVFTTFGQSKTLIAETSYDETSGRIRFENLNFEIIEEDPFLYVAFDLDSDAKGAANLVIESESDLVLDRSELTFVNGSEQTTFSDLPLSSGSTPLPVELTRLEATASSDGVALEWRTVSEQNNAGFRVQRRVVDASAPGARRVVDEASEDWSRVGRVDGSGTTSSPQTYRFTDEGLPAGADTLQYRLAQVDLDGTVNLSDPVTVGRGGPDGARLLDTYPNPARTRATVALAVPEQASGDATLRLYDVLGRQVRTVDGAVEPGRSTATVDVSGLPSGVYVLRLSADGTTRTRRLTVVK